MADQEKKECKKTGNFLAKIAKVDWIDHRFRPEKGFELKVEFQTQDLFDGAAYLDFTADYAQGGTHKGERQCDISSETLTTLFGINVNDDPNSVDSMIGKTVSFNGVLKKKDESDTVGRFTYYLSTFKPEVKVARSDVKNKLASVFKKQEAPAESMPAGSFANPFLQGGQQQPATDGVGI